jgi:hypothetical protein
MDGQQELWFDAVRDDPTTSDAEKVRLLHECAADYWRKLEWANKRFEMRDAEATAWAEQATRSAGALAAREAEVAQTREVLAEAIIQLGGELRVPRPRLVERGRWVMAGPERLPPPDDGVLWRAALAAPPPGDGASS